MEVKEEVPKLSKERVNEIQRGSDEWRGKEEDQDEETEAELWEEFVHEDMTIEELKAKYILTRR
jgi:hypothetical protein